MDNILHVVVVWYNYSNSDYIKVCKDISNFQKKKI